MKMNKKNEIVKAIKKLEKLNGDKKKSFNMILDYFAFKLGIKNSTFSAKIDERNIIEKINVELYKGDDYIDFFGEIYEDIYGINLVEYNTSDERCLSVRFKISKGKIKSLYIKECETGRTIMSFRKNDKDIRFFCTESDVGLYRIALVNSKLYDIPCKLINNITEKGCKGKKHISPNTFKTNQSNIWAFL